MDDNVLIQTENLHVRFPRQNGDIYAARSLNLEVKEGETLALVGESGSGKTSTGHALVRLLRPESGTIRFEGEDVTRIRGKRLARYHGLAQLIFQDPFASLNPFHTVSYHLQRPLRRLGGLSPKTARKRCQELLAQVGLTPSATFESKYPHELSGGQRQRVAIARSLAADPRFVVCDEPISMLDVSLRAGILQLLESLQASQGLSYLYITHDLASARYLSQRIAVMYGGSLVEIAEAEELIQAPAHPYTQLLLQASVSPPGQEIARLPEKEPGAPDLGITRRGCPFAPRCLYALPKCAKEMPQLIPVAPGHESACFLLSPSQGN
ncbi:MAG: ABC transporter ATP-binding protein [Sulfobacillus benefaciens]|uniref:ABC transporter ATP-binding protein n=1 Tax=Sulfobacillus benefaciens TaxID=453960 RepID=A0A2T2X8G9_9FIRM|nr:MAG: ABC transporter ATP-binding protein [Sulfobacillus benefaciens]